VVPAAGGRCWGGQVGYESFTAVEGVRAKLGKRIVQALKMNDDGVHYAAIDVLDCLMQPMHNYYDLLQEQLNKRSLLMSKSFLTGFVYARLAGAARDACDACAKQWGPWHGVRAV